MNIKLSFSEGILLRTKDGASQPARVLVVEYQRRPRDRWRKANIIVDTESIPDALEAAAAYLRQEGV